MYQNDLGLGDTVATSFLLVLDIGNRPTCHQHCHSHDKKHPSTAYHYTGYTDKKRSIHFSMHQLETAPLEPPQLRRRNVRNTYPTFMTHPSSFAQQFPAHDDCTRGGFCCKDGMPRSLPGKRVGIAEQGLLYSFNHSEFIQASHTRRGYQAPVSPRYRARIGGCPGDIHGVLVRLFSRQRQSRT